MELVTTINGNTADKSDCRKMSGVYYLKGDVTIENSGECYLINGKYYKYNTGYIIYDHSKKQYILKNEIKDGNFIEIGIVGLDEKEKPILGGFSINNVETLPILNHKNKLLYCINDDILKNSKLYLENLEDGYYYSRYMIDSYKFIYPAKCDQNYKNSLSYDSRKIIKNYKKSYDELYNPEYHNFIKNDSFDITKGLSFGLEFETTMGYVPTRICKKLGLIPLRDGSINGLEYVTIPLEGKKGFQTVIDTVEELKKRTKYDNNCSLHLHIGNIPRTEEFFISLFKVLYLLQDEMFSMFPFHKKENYGVKRKHYTKPLPEKETMLLFDSCINSKDDLIKNFDILYNFLSMGQKYSDVKYDLNNIKNHPSDPKGEAKWNIRTRYFWVNMIPLLFGNKETVEFRIHTPTYDINKIINYMITCFSIIDFTIKNQNNILKNFKNYINLNLNEVVYESYYNKCFDNRLIESIRNYYDYRKKHFYERTRNGDFLAPEKDFKYNFKHLDWTKKVNISSKTIYNKEILDDLRIELERGYQIVGIREGIPLRFDNIHPPVPINNQQDPDDNIINGFIDEFGEDNIEN
jgi:hypothetical protein